MRKRLRIFVVPGVIGLSALGLLSWCSHVENPIEAFATYEEMEASGAMMSGWIPVYIPRSARDIRETHNLDTSIVRMRFNYDPGDTAMPDRHCQRSDLTNRIDYRCPLDSGTGQHAVLRLYHDGRGTYANE